MKNLTQPRYLVIADYPRSPFNVGNILTQHTQFNKDAYWVNDNLYTDRHPEDYPHIFRLLHWWEYRDENEMPEYVKGFGNQISGSFYSEIQLSNDRMFYAKLIKEYSNHEVGRIYYISKQHDNTLYSGDSRGIGQGGYVSNVIDSYFEKSTKEDYDSQNYHLIQ